MLRDGPYPWHLKQRITSRNGHLSNFEAADFIHSSVNGRTRHIALAHLSRTNNEPKLAQAASRAALEDSGKFDVRLHVTSQFDCAETINLEE